MEQLCQVVQYVGGENNKGIRIKYTLISIENAGFKSSSRYGYGKRKIKNDADAPQESSANVVTESDVAFFTRGENQYSCIKGNGSGTKGNGKTISGCYEKLQTVMAFDYGV